MVRVSCEMPVLEEACKVDGLSKRDNHASDLDVLGSSQHVKAPAIHPPP